MLEQVVMNLAVNARDAMPDGGVLTLSSSVLELDSADALPHPEARSGKFVRFSVSDTGCGIDAATLQHIFEPFFTTKDIGKGSGLGLATAYGIIKQHRGWITVETEVGKGTTFHVLLPAASSTSAKSKQPSRPQLPQGGTETILLVEDDASVRQGTASLLRHWGYRVLEADSGVQALERWQDVNGRIDLLFTDMVMPGGLNGLGLAEQLQSLRRGLRVIISSGYSDRLADQAATPDGFTFLGKPCAPHDVVAAIRKVLA